MDSSPQLKIRWNNFPVTVSSSLEALRNNGDLVDTSLFCEGHRFLAHRVVLSATSNYFRQIFKEISSPNVAIVLSGLNYQDIDALLTFIYSGEVSLCDAQLPSFLKTAETLQVKGLGPECTSSLSRKTDGNKNDTSMQETQFLAAALQKPLSSKRATPPPLLSVYSSALSVTPVTTTTSVTTTASLPSLDLSLAISNFANSASSSSSSNPSDVGLKKRKMAEPPDGYLKTEIPEERRTEHLAMTDMTPPNSITNEELSESTQSRQELVVQERNPPPRSDPTPRPYQSQCRGERPRNARVPFCPHCGEDCHNISVLRYHVKTTHSEPNGCLCCCFCTAIFNLHSSAEYKQHTLDTHGVKYT
ncbi:hypothetical protein GHT06_015558 [Daphnia sinensis]|uniref:BTB domain-containing protein n=1 Tax=Daphnia sinensis TaxID=1820382 RepID=A0AAD5KR59_9CRUS|nr:hypothetical protein GHT06_015558 [Daphnia sinensis]